MTKVLLDTNILIYSIDVKSQFYSAAKNFLEKLIQSENKIYIPDKALYEFYRVLSSPAFKIRMQPGEGKNIWRSFAFSEVFEIIYSDKNILKITDRLSRMCFLYNELRYVLLNSSFVNI